MGRFVRELVDPKAMKGDTEIGYIAPPPELSLTGQVKVKAANLYPEVFAMLKVFPKILDAAVKALEALHTIGDGAGDTPDWKEGGDYLKAYEGLGAAVKATREARLGNVPAEE